MNNDKEEILQKQKKLDQQNVSKKKTKSNTIGIIHRKKRTKGNTITQMKIQLT